MTSAATPSNRTIEVFRPGTFTPMVGAAISYSADDLRAIAAAYDGNAAPAPVVVGHPKTDDPAFGWIKGFRFDETSQRLLADVGELEPAFSDAVGAGRYKRVSLSFFPPTSPANPKPGTWYPKHLGFLGAAAPAVTGLKPVSFAADDDAISFEFASGARESAGLFRRMRDWMIDQFGLETADRVLPDYEIRWLDDIADLPDAPSPSAFSAPALEEEPMSQPAKPPATADFAAREADIAQREQRIAERERTIAHDANVAFAAQLVDSGRLLPAQRERLVVVLDAVDAGESSVSFAAGEAAQRPGDALRAMLKDLPQSVPLGRVPADAPDAGASVSFAAPDGREVDPERMRVHERALAYQRQHAGTDYLTAVRAVEAGA